MPNGRFPVALVLLLAGGTALVLGGLDDRWSRPPVTVAIERLRAGDLDMAERRKTWTALVDRAIAGEQLTAVQRLAAAMAAVALGDRERYQRITATGGLSAAQPVMADHVEDLDSAALGEPALTVLLDAMRRELAGDRMAAAAGYRTAVESGNRWRLPLVVELAAAGVERTRS